MEPLPTEPNEFGDLRSSVGSSLGSLAQTARTKKLRQARMIMIVIGILTIVANGALLLLLPSQVKKELDKEIAKAKAQGMIVDEAKVEEVRAESLKFGYLVGGVAVALGVVFVVLGLVVNQYPVPATVLGLVLYVGAAVVFGLLNPPSIYAGIIIKIIIVVGLIKAVQAAVAYQKELNKQAAALESGM